MRKKWYLATTIALSLAAASSARAQTQPVYYVWNNSTGTWETPTAWTPTGPPTITDYAEFDSNSGLSAFTLISNPVISAADAALSLIVGNDYGGGGWTFAGSGSLTLGSSGSTVSALNIVGAQNTIINLPTVNLAVNNGSTANSTAGAATAVKIANGSNLILPSSTSFNINSASQTNSGIIGLLGTLTLDDTGAAATSNILVQGTAAPVFLLDGGTLAYNANAAGGHQTAGYIYGSTGVNKIIVNQTGSGQAILTLPLSTVAFTAGGSAVAANSLRAATSMTLDFIGEGGVLSSTTSGTGPIIDFTATPDINTTNRLFANSVSATNATLGFAIETDSNGVNFAELASDNVSVVSAVNSPSYVSGTNLFGTGAITVAATSVVQYSPSTSETATANVSGDTLRISPSTSGLTLNMSTFTLAVQALMLDGSIDYTINGTNTTKGLLGTGSTRYIYINNPATTLFTNEIVGIGTGGTPTTIAGPGFLVLTSTSSQNTATTTSALNLVGGTIRGNNTQLNLTGSGGTGGVFKFSGGVIEITGGTDGTGASADFSRPLGLVSTAGAVNFTYGGGGFSAYGASASVSIGGATPSTIQWDATSQLTSGSPLIFGSIKSNARLDFLNPLNLTTATTANTSAYDERQIEVIGNSADSGTANSGDYTNIQGVISGNANSDLLKTGTGTLELTGTNTYSGNTLVDGGTLVAASTAATGTGTVIVNSGGTLGAGTSGGTVSSVVLNRFGVIKPTTAIVGGSGATTLTISSALELNGGTFGSAAAGFGWTLGSDLVDDSAGTFDASSSSLDTTFDFAGDGTSGTTYNLVKYGTLGTNLSAGTASTNFMAVGATGTFAYSGGILQFTDTSGTSTTPEPGALALIAAGLVPLGVLRRSRRARKTI